MVFQKIQLQTLPGGKQLLLSDFIRQSTLAMWTRLDSSKLFMNLKPFFFFWLRFYAFEEIHVGTRKPKEFIREFTHKIYAIICLIMLHGGSKSYGGFAEWVLHAVSCLWSTSYVHIFSIPSHPSGYFLPFSQLL